MKIHKKIHAHYVSRSTRHQQLLLLIAGFFCLFLIILIVKGCHALFEPKKTLPEPLLVRQGNQIIIPSHSPLRTQMTVKTVSASHSPHIVSLPGTVEADPTRIVNILPPLTGRLLSIPVKLGDMVKAGQELAVISSPDLALAYADNDKAQSTLKLTERAFKRAQSVNQSGGNSIKDVQLAQNDYNQAIAEANRAKARLITLGNNTFSRLSIRAPIAGRVTALNYGQGSYITDPTALLMSLTNIEMVWITVNVPQNLIGAVAANQSAKIIVPTFPEHTLEGKITFVNAYLESDTRRNKTRIAFKNPDEILQPNMYVNVKISVPQPERVMIPISAILMNDDTTSVYVETAPWIFERRHVQLGMEDGLEIRVLSGLKAQERIATAGGIFIND